MTHDTLCYLTDLYVEENNYTYICLCISIETKFLWDYFKELTFKPWRCASELKSTFDIKNPVAYSLPPRKEKPNAGAERRGRNNRTTRTRRSIAPAVPARPEPDVVDAVDVAYIATTEIKKEVITMKLFT